MSTEDRNSFRPRPALSKFDVVMITVGIVIGAGIFQTPALVAQIAGSPATMLTAWVLGGVLTMIGALCYAELASTYPSAGGDYGFLTRAYGRNLSFMFAWSRSLVIITGSIALLGFILGDYLTRIYSLGPYSAAIYAAASVVLLTTINLIGLRSSSRMQNVLTIVEVSGVLLVAALAMTLDPGAHAGHAHTHETGGEGAFGLAMVFVLLAYGGWNEAAYVSAEVRGGGRAILHTLVISIAVITLAYVAFVSSVWSGLGFETLASSQAVGVDVAERALGAWGGDLIGVLVAVASLTSMNSTMLVGARTNHALGRDWRSLASLAQWREERNTPVIGFITQAAVAIALIGFGAIEKQGFATMVEFTAPVFWLFFLLSGASLFVLRRTDPGATRPFRTPLYPVLPLIFVLTCAYLLYSSISYARSEHAVHVALIVVASGVFALFALRRREARLEQTADSASLVRPQQP